MATNYKTEEHYNQALQRPITFHIGKSAAGNFGILDIASEPDNIWFHINQESSAHVIAIMPDDLDRKQVKYIIKQGAVLCKQHSRYKTAKNPVEVLYAKVKHVQKTDVLGTVQVKEGKVVRV